MGLAAVTAMDDNAELLTVSVVVPVIDPAVAVMVEVPAATPVANPFPSMVAVDVEDELQVTPFTVAVLPSSFTPVAVNC